MQMKRILLHLGYYTLCLLIYTISFPVSEMMFRGPLHMQRATGDAKIFRQSIQKSARRVDPLRRNFVTRPLRGPTEKIPAILRAMNF